MQKIYRRLLKSASVFLFLFGIATVVSAQQRPVTGAVKDVAGSGMPGVNVIKKGTTIGTATDANGNFSIEAADDDVLVISFIGYLTQEIRVGSQSRIEIVLTEDISTLQEVVVVGYGTQKKSDLTGAIASVSGDNLRGTITASLDQALQGRVAGVQITQNSGAPGGVSSIRIRGTTSLTQSSEPLYVIDGIQVGGNASSIAGFDWFSGAGGQQQAASNPLASINPEDIESIEVLKDASATAIYGSRAANGVIIITTKRGKTGEATISYNGYYAVQEVYKTFDMMDLPAYAEYNNEVAREISGINANPRFADPSLLPRGTDWQDAVFQVAPMQSHSLTVTGGSERTKYMVSGGYFKQDGIIIGSGFNRINMRLNLDSRIKENINVGASLSLARKDETITLNDGGDGVISQAAQMAPHIPVRDFNGEFAGPAQNEQSAQAGTNPVGLALLRNNTVLNNRLMSNLFGDIEIIKGLRFRSEIALDLGFTQNLAFVPSYEWGRTRNVTSQLAQRSDQSYFWLWKNYATYTKSFGSHELTGMLGLEAQKGQFESFTAYKINLPNNLPVMNQGQIGNIPNTGNKSWNTLASQFARVNYSYSDKYLLTATIRRDGSSRFGPSRRWGVFPSVSAAWRISNESFMSNVEVISNLKLRAGWGQVGNQEINNYAFGSSLRPWNSYFGPAVINNAYSNPFVQWESTSMTNVGLDLEMFAGRVSLTFDAYRKVTDNLLLRVNLPATFGEGDIIGGPQANVGSMENNGIELGLTTVNVDAGKFRWTTSGNISINRNEVTSLGGSTPLIQNLYWYPGFETATRTDVGYPVGQFYGYIMDGIFKSKEEILNHAVQIQDSNDPNVNKIDRTSGLWLGDVKWRDVSGPNGVPDGRITSDDQTVIGDPNPDFTFGLNNSFSYGPFELGVFLIGTVGGDILNYSRARNEQMVAIFDNQAATVENRARTRLIEGVGTDIGNIDHVELVNPETNMPRFDNAGENNNHYMSSRWIEDGTYVRVQNVKLSYTLPSRLSNKVRMSSVQVYTNIQNLATFTNYTGLDPQIGAFNQSPLQQNVDLGRYPSPRVYTFGLNVNF